MVAGGSARGWWPACYPLPAAFGVNWWKGAGAAPPSASPCSAERQSGVRGAGGRARGILPILAPRPAAGSATVGRGAKRARPAAG